MSTRTQFYTYGKRASTCVKERGREAHDSDRSAENTQTVKKSEIQKYTEHRLDTTKVRITKCTSPYTIWRIQANKWMYCQSTENQPQALAKNVA